MMARLLRQVSAFRPGEQSCWWWVLGLRESRGGRGSDGDWRGD